MRFLLKNLLLEYSVLYLYYLQLEQRVYAEEVDFHKYSILYMYCDRLYMWKIVNVFKESV
jgi:hypothetical protein